MKCENCGGNLSLEDLACPHCGTINRQAQQHVRDMRRYQGEFQDTQKNVYAVTRRYAGITTRVVIIAVLLIITVVFAIFASESYSIKRHILQNRAERNFEKYSAKIEQYLEDEDYIALYAFAEANYIDAYDNEYEKYLPMIRVCNQYTYLYEYIMGYHTKVQQGDDAEYIENQIQYMGEQLNYFYDTLDMENYSYYESVDVEKTQMILARIEEQVKVLLRTYCGLTQEDVESLDGLSEARRMVLLEERMNYEK